MHIVTTQKTIEPAIKISVLRFGELKTAIVSKYELSEIASFFTAPKLSPTQHTSIANPTLIIFTNLFKIISNFLSIKIFILYIWVIDFKFQVFIRVSYTHKAHKSRAKGHFHFAQLGHDHLAAYIVLFILVIFKNIIYYRSV